MARPRIFPLLVLAAAACSCAAIALHLASPMPAAGATAAEPAGVSEVPVSDAPSVATAAAILPQATAEPSPLLAAVPSEPEHTPAAAEPAAESPDRLTLPSWPEKAVALLDQMNEARLREGLQLLELSPDLDGVALARANDLVARNYFDHVSATGESAFSEIAAREILYRIAGENLARNDYAEGRTVQTAFEALMASDGHRANILEPRYSMAGIAVVQVGRTWLYVTVFTN